MWHWKSKVYIVRVAGGVLFLQYFMAVHAGRSFSLVKQVKIKLSPQCVIKYWMSYLAINGLWLQKLRFVTWNSDISTIDCHQLLTWYAQLVAQIKTSAKRWIVYHDMYSTCIQKHIVMILLNFLWIIYEDNV